MVETISPIGSPAQPPPPTVIVEPRRRGCGFWMGWILALLFFGVAVLLFFITLAVSVSQISTLATPGVLGTTLTEKTVEGSGKDKVLLLPLRGLIGERPTQSVFYSTEGTVQYIHQRLKAAREDSAVKAVLFEVDSPGGEITASDILNEEIQRFKKETNRKVVVCMGDVAASGAYYATAGSDWIVAHPTTITGSIGVVMMNFDATVLLQKIGVQDNPIKSGPYKDMGSWTRPMTPEERQLLQDLIDEMLGRFVKVVADGRKLSPEKVKALADGRIFSATQAKAAGLVDQIGYHQDALQKVKELAKLKQAKVVRYDKAFSFASFFEAEAEGVLKRPFSLDGLVRDLAYPRGPRLMYLWTGR